MTPGSTIRYAHGLRPAVSLIEVVVAIFLAGNLLVGVLLAMTSHARQAKQMQLSQVGIDLLDQFLCSWSTHDFREERVAIAMHGVGLVPAISAESRESVLAFGNGQLVNIQVVRLQGDDFQRWGLQKIRVEALSTLNGEVVAKLEILREVPRVR